MGGGLGPQQQTVAWFLPLIIAPSMGAWLNMILNLRTQRVQVSEIVGACTAKDSCDRSEPKNNTMSQH
jgi:hypothetical protein